ncbi:ABC transporter ATP-binding protein [Pseudogemmobacter bohemicus]|uniref:ABC transporter ATP-binding protein n=1 Tax=Pseudogemmobacter bohemicus TaxID=2250708 RepID=UPI000DD46F3C|nr:ABC transporter ATP-binding protein [Pseudogemmobacter bohemicus]
MSLLSLENITVRRGTLSVVDGVSLTVSAGEFVGLIGPNGAGKTSLMRAALGLLPHEGRSNLAQMSAARRARAVAFLPQGREIAWPVSVADLVALGRAPWGNADPADPAVRRALARLDLEGFASRAATSLSGGEQARALIARALAQETPLLIADEPGAGLDPEAQIRMMTIFAGLAQDGRAVLASVHDLGLAARHCTRLILLERGRLVADGPPREVLSEARLAGVFHIRAHLFENEDGLIFQPLGVIR